MTYCFGFIDPDGLNMLVTDFAVSPDFVATMHALAPIKNARHDTWGGAATILRDLPVAPKQVNKAVVEEQLAAVLAEVQAGDAASAAQQAGALAAALNEARQTGVDLSTPAAHQWPLLLLQPHSCLRRVTCLPT